MLGTGPVVTASFLYLGLLFGIAWWCDRRADRGRSVIDNPAVYALSLAVYCTAWTFFGSVGLASTQGVAFLPIYLGPTLMAALWPLLLTKILRIAKTQRITSIADFVASRYGKSPAVAALVAVIAVVGVVPYIALQLKAVSASFSLVSGRSAAAQAPGLFADSALYIALLMGAFAIMFGTRKIDATERHEGLVAAVAFESLVKLGAFLAVGAFVCFGLFDGPRELFARAAAEPQVAALLDFETSVGGYGRWLTLLLLSMFAIMFLPRQFQLAVVENVDERHVRRAAWLFPAYLWAINLFVLPVALGGLLYFGGRGVEADSYVLALPLAAGHTGLALLVYLGGLSAATSMIIVETTALATMVSNDLVLPALLRWRRFRAGAHDLAATLLNVRRGAIIGVVLLGLAYFRLAGEARTLVSIGLISFAAVAQFAPAFLGGLYWKDATRAGALCGLGAGFVLWAYTLLMPSFAVAGGLAATVTEHGPLGIALLRPTALFGLAGLDQLTHSVFWSLLFNAGGFVAVSLATRAGAAESAQAALFVDALDRPARAATVRLWRGGAPVEELRLLLERIVGAERATRVFDDYARQHGAPQALTDAGLQQHVESELAGSIGSASARIMVASIAREEPLSLDEVLGLLDETSQAIHYGRELAARTEELRRANEQLRQLDRMKDDFVATVTHELRTPLTSIRALSEILHDHPDLDAAQRERFLRSVIQEAERLTRLINQVLDLAKLESGSAEWRSDRVSLDEAVDDALGSTAQLFRDRRVALVNEPHAGAVVVRADRDRVLQVMLNLLSNALRFAAAADGRVVVRVRQEGAEARVEVADNGAGIPREEQDLIFEKFRQRSAAPAGRGAGTGLGLAISRELVQRMGGRLWVESEPGRGATFCFTLPLEHA